MSNAPGMNETHPRPQVIKEEVINFSTCLSYLNYFEKYNIFTNLLRRQKHQKYFYFHSLRCHVPILLHRFLLLSRTLKSISKLKTDLTGLQLTLQNFQATSGEMDQG